MATPTTDPATTPPLEFDECWASAAAAAGIGVEPMALVVGRVPEAEAGDVP